MGFGRLPVSPFGYFKIANNLERAVRHPVVPERSRRAFRSSACAIRHRLWACMYKGAGTSAAIGGAWKGVYIKNNFLVLNKSKVAG
jgi:hypothetical protein